MKSLPSIKKFNARYFQKKISGLIPSSKKQLLPQIKSAQIGSASILLAILYLGFKPALIFLFPGLTLYQYFQRHRFNPSDSLIFSLITSLSYWICSFWILKYIPISHTQLIDISLIVSMLYFVIQLPKIHLTLSKSDLFTFTFALITIILFTPFYTRFLTPPSADMATQIYITRLIMDTNGFPRSFEPILPVKHFGSAPTGLATLAAAISLNSHLPVYKSPLLISAIAFMILSLSLYSLLTSIFPQTISALATFIIMFYSKDITEYFMWGGNMTILSISLLLMTVSLLLRFIRQHQITHFTSFILSVFAYAAFTSHHIPFIAAAYFLPFVGIYLLVKQPRHLQHFLSFLTLLVIFSIPFLTSLRIPSSSSINIIYNWQHDAQFNPSWKSGMTALPGYIQKRLGTGTFYFMLLGFLFSIRSPLKYKPWFYLSIGVYFALLINNLFWVLPLSPLLYPDRITTLFAYVPAFFIAVALLNLQKISTKYLKLPFVWLLVVLIVIPLPFKPFSLIRDSLKIYRQRLNSHWAMLTKADDLKAFRWIETYTPPNAVIMNRYGDAGIYLPGIAGRKVTINDSGPYEFDELYIWEKSLPTTDYAYIGSYHMYGHPEFTLEDLTSNPQKYTLVYSSGNAKVFQVNKSY